MLLKMSLGNVILSILSLKPFLTDSHLSGLVLIGLSGLVLIGLCSIKIAELLAGCILIKPRGVCHESESRSSICIRGFEKQGDSSSMGGLPTDLRVCTMHICARPSFA
jgi:hypothetical protein